MTTPVDSSTTDARALATASVDRTRNGATNDQDGTLVHIGGGLYLSAGHVFFQFVNPDAPRTAEDYRITTGAGLDTPLTHTVTGPDFSDTFVNYGWGTDGGPDISSVLTPDTTDVQIPMIIYADANEATGTLSSFGYPVDGGFDGTTMVEVTGNLTAGSHQDIPTGNGDMSVLVSDIGMQVFSGQSGSGMWLTNDVDGDGIQETYLAGIVSLDVQFVGDLHATGFEPLGDIYTQLASTIDTAGLSADDFARATLVSGQTLASAFTTVEGTSLHEDILGGQNADTLSGHGGDDHITGAAGSDVLDGGAGRDTLDGGAGADSLTDGLGVDRMTGGADADTFVMSADRKADIIVDFQNGSDVIDIANWGVTNFVALTVTDHVSGRVRITYDDETIMVDDGARGLTAADFDATDFVFANGTDPLDTVSGTEGNDKLLGTLAAEEIHDLGGADNIFGRGGADQFVMAADGAQDWIKDFEDGSDLIDVSAWGAGELADLTITQQRAGRVSVVLGDETLLVSDGARSILASDLTADDFIFA